MRSWDKIQITWTVTITTLTGLVLLAYALWPQPGDEYTILNHPWQGAIRNLHLLVAPLMVWAVGKIWNTHIRSKKASQQQDNRSTGLLMDYSFIAMILSGVFYQIAVSDGGRQIWFWTHSILGVAWGLAFCCHQMLALRLKGKKESIS